MPNTLLVVDDSIIIREMIKDCALANGWTIAGEADNGKDAIDRYLELKPSAMTLDLIMPDFDGLFALRGVRAADPEAKVLVVSALEQKAVLREALALGAADFIVKPFAVDRMSSALGKLAEQFAATT